MLNLEKKEVSIEEVKRALIEIFQETIKSLEINQDVEMLGFWFRLEFLEIRELLLPDGICLKYVDFEEKSVEGVVHVDELLITLREQRYFAHK